MSYQGQPYMSINVIELCTGHDNVVYSDTEVLHVQIQPLAVQGLVERNGVLNPTSI